MYFNLCTVPGNMFKKRRNKKRKKRPRADLPSSDGERANHADARRGEGVADETPPRHDLLEATRAEQEERKKRRVAIYAGNSSMLSEVKRRRSNKLVLSKVGANLPLGNDESVDKDMDDFIAAHMMPACSNPSGSHGKDSNEDGSSDVSTEAYAILRRQKKTLATEAGGASDIAGSGIAGIGIFEVNLSDDERRRNAKATAEALASAMSESQLQSSTPANLPSSFSGNFVSRGKMMTRQPAVRLADGNVSNLGFSRTDRPRDRESLRNFVKNDRR